MPDHKRAISDRLREAREAAGVTQAEAAQALGVSYVSISRWETGARKPGKANIERALAYYRKRLSETIPENVPRGTQDLNQPWPSLISRFGREALRKGATDSEVDFLQAALALPEAATIVYEELPESLRGDTTAVFKHAGEVFRGLMGWIEARAAERRPDHSYDVPPIPLGTDPFTEGGAESDAPGEDRANRRPA